MQKIKQTSQFPTTSGISHNLFRYTFKINIKQITALCRTPSFLYSFTVNLFVSLMSLLNSIMEDCPPYVYYVASQSQSLLLFSVVP